MSADIAESQGAFDAVEADESGAPTERVMHKKASSARRINDMRRR
ncbi:MAG TPA: hypothetical protein VEC60_06755 [Reyranella sp.]|nr:hypothetical protein [Reyranella sp.]